MHVACFHPLSRELLNNYFMSCCLQVAVHEEHSSLNAKEATMDRLMNRMDQLQLQVSERPRAVETKACCFSSIAGKLRSPSS